MASILSSQIVSGFRNAGIHAGDEVVMVRYPTPDTDRAHNLHLLRGVYVLNNAVNWAAADIRFNYLTNYENLTRSFPTQLAGRYDDVRTMLAPLTEPALHTQLTTTLAETVKPDYIVVIGEFGLDWESGAAGPGLFRALQNGGYELASSNGMPSFIRFFRRISSPPGKECRPALRSSAGNTLRRFAAMPKFQNFERLAEVR